MATTARHGLPYIWVSWLTSWLADEDRCAWRPWFRAHFQAPKQTDPTFNLDAWKSDHKKMREAEAKRLRLLGYTVAEEMEVKIQGERALLAGKVDILAVKYDEVFGPCTDALIVDLKGGKRRGADLWQVSIYVWAVPLKMPDLKTVIRGEVLYADGTRIPITREEVAPKVRDIVDAITLVAAKAAPDRAPSFQECSFCDVTDEDCPSRIKEGEMFARTEAF